ncbi:MAG: galactokinase [Solirubrobacteraceae bacterium]|nr:galactokinase [Solirubrobacteraceae bacterium]
MPPDRARAFAPGRVNLIGEHTDYNGGVALPFAISRGVVVDALASEDRRVSARALDLNEEDSFSLRDRARVDDWRAFVRGAVAELTDAGLAPSGARLQIGGDLPRGAGLSSSAALEVALSLALLALSGVSVEGGLAATGDAAGGGGATGSPRIGRLALARLCARVENEWVGAQTGLLDQLASLFGIDEHALLIDFALLEHDDAPARAIEPVPLRLGGWRLVVLDSGERHSHAGGGYNERRAECARACELLGVAALSQAHPQDVARLPSPLRERAEHVLFENDRVRAATRALRDDDLATLGELLSASHASLRDLYAISTPAVEAAVARLLGAGAAGARIIGGGFGGCVLGLFAPGATPPPDALEVRPGPGAHLLG